MEEKELIGEQKYLTNIQFDSRQIKGDLKYPFLFLSADKVAEANLLLLMRSNDEGVNLVLDDTLICKVKPNFYFLRNLLENESVEIWLDENTSIRRLEDLKGVPGTLCSSVIYW